MGPVIDKGCAPKHDSGFTALSFQARHVFCNKNCLGVRFIFYFTELSFLAQELNNWPLAEI
jgi:hypothetical protein